LDTSPAKEPLSIPTAKEYTFKAGDWAVHPSHGVGLVDGIEDKSFGDTTSSVYVLKILGSELKVMVPLTNALRVGLRPVMSSQEVDGLFAVLATTEMAVETQTWNRRFRAYTEMLSSGSPTEIAKVLRDMHRLKFDKELSFGERRLLDHSLSLLVQEMALAKRETPEQITQEIEEVFAR